jgi:hypothetical protein
MECSDPMGSSDSARDDGSSPTVTIVAAGLLLALVGLLVLQPVFG